MAVEKITAAGVMSFTDQLASFRHGKCYIGSGGYTKSEADTAFADLTAKAAELLASYDELSDLADKPGKEESTVERLKTSNYVIEGKRTNKITLNLVGLSQARKDWMESTLNSLNVTILLESSDGKDVLVFNSLRWVYERSNEFNGLYNATISTEFAGVTSLKYLIYKGLTTP